MAVKEKTGVVVSDSMINTRIVAVSDRVNHKRYSKVVTRTKRYAVHDQDSVSKIGDLVKIQQSQPISKTKKWVLLNILRKSSCVRLSNSTLIGNLPCNSGIKSEGLDK